MKRIFENVVGRNESAHAGCRINVGMTADYGTGIQHGIAAYFHFITEHCTEFLKSGFDSLVFVLYNYQGLVALNVARYGTGAHVGLKSEHGISDIIVMRNLHVVEKNHVL